MDPRFFRFVDHGHRKAQTTHDVLCQVGIIYPVRGTPRAEPTTVYVRTDFVLRRSVITGPDVIF